MSSPQRRWRFRPNLDHLEERSLLAGLIPSQMTHAYGLDTFHFNYANGRQVAADGTGQTIAIIGAYHDATIQSNVDEFDRYFGLPKLKISQYWYGAANSTDDGWAEEEAMDVEWAHVMAPGAKIMLVEAKSNLTKDFLTAVDWARRQPGVTAVSMSWLFKEWSGETANDRYFVTPAGHPGVTFIACSGDDGAYKGPAWPSVSPNVVAAGGTSLYVDAAGNYQSESGWSGSGGGYSKYYRKPSYQNGFISGSWRTTPDISLDADPDTGSWIYWTRPSTGATQWNVYAGTSLAAPLLAGLTAVANQGRAVIGKAPLDGATQTIPTLYSRQMTNDFRDVTTGYNGYYAGRGYDLVTGRGSPSAFGYVRELMAVASKGKFGGSAGGLEQSFDSAHTGIVLAHNAAETPVGFVLPATPKRWRHQPVRMG